MSESKPFHPETEKSRGMTRDPDFTSGPKTPQEILASLGDKFVVTFDACLEVADQKKFDIEKLTENISKLHPQYLEHVKNLFENGVVKVLEEKKQLRTDEEIETEKNNLSNLMESFVKRVEFFSRLKPPEKVQTGGRTVEQLERAMEKAEIIISDSAREMMHTTTTTDKYGTFTTTKETKIIDFVRCRVKDLFRDSEDHTFEKILSKAKELGLELCQSEDGPNYRLHCTNELEGEWVVVGMKQISDPDGRPRVFGIDRDNDEPWLWDFRMIPACRLDSWREFVFRLSSPEPEKDKTQLNH